MSSIPLAKPQIPKREYGFRERIQMHIHNRWPEIDAEVTANRHPDTRTVKHEVRLKVSYLRKTAGVEADDLNRIREVVGYVERSLRNEFEKVIIQNCPTPRHHSDVRAPRFSHLDGSSWIFCCEHSKHP